MKCNLCGSSFYFYFKKDGSLFGYPDSWGNPIAVQQELIGMEIERSQERVLPKGITNANNNDDIIVQGDYYYTFIDKHGNMLRVTIGLVKFDKDNPRPKNIPKSVDCYHTWTVDMCPKQLK